MKRFFLIAIFAWAGSIPSTSYSQIPDIERIALIQLFNNTGGLNWKENTGWLGNIGTECDWYGVTCSEGSIQLLLLKNNSLSGSIPSELGNLSKLVVLDLRENLLTGPIPLELSYLSELEDLGLAKNSLTGSIPPELGNMSNLVSLELLENSLTGSIPVELASLSKLNTLHLADNSLSGSIPPELGNLSNLVTLSLNDNLLTGSIPSEIGNLIRLVVLTLQENSLSGSIPSVLGNLTELTNLHLSGNSLSGSIPAELGNLTKLRVLLLYDNSLSGSIPSVLGNLTELSILWLWGNSLSGSIPPELGNLTNNLVNLILAGNQLSGSIPSELGNLTGLTTLMLHDNMLTGTIPSSLVGLTNLSALRLDDNYLTGPTPQWLSDMGISNLNVDNAFRTMPIVTISGGNRTISDTDGSAGESVSFVATATDSDGTIESTQWLVAGTEVAIGLSPTIALPNGSTTLAFKATDNDGLSATTLVTITITAPSYNATDEWPSPYNGVTPDSSLGLSLNNIGSYDAADSKIYTCLRAFTNDLPASVGGISEFDITLTIVSLDEGTVQIDKLREFNIIGALNENIELPDCSGKFETTTGVYTDTIETKLYLNLLGNSLSVPVIKTFEMTFSLIDPANLILKLEDYKELTAN